MQNFLQLQQEKEAQLCWLETGSERTLKIKKMGCSLLRQRDTCHSAGERIESAALWPAPV